MGSHHAQVLHHIPPYTSGSDSAFSWQGDGAGGGYRPLYASQTRPLTGWPGAPADQATVSLHASMAQALAEVKSLTARVTDLSEREAENGKKIEQLLTCVKGLEAQVNKPGGPVEPRPGKSSGGSRRVCNEHPLLKVRDDTILPVIS